MATVYTVSDKMDININDLTEKKDTMGKRDKNGHSIIKTFDEEDNSNPLDDKPGLELDSTEKRTSTLLYNISDKPPIHLTILFAFQQALLPLSSSLAISFIVADVVCAGDNEDIKTKLLSSTLLMNGVTTLLMVTVGIRLPLFQSAASDYIVPLLVMASLNPDRCNPTTDGGTNNLTSALNSTMNGTSDEKLMIIYSNIQAMQGSLLAAGLIHFLIGITGLVGLLLRFIGPVTIVPTILLTGLYLVRAATKFAKVHWGISSMVAVLALLFSVYLSKVQTPIPFWTKKKGFHIIRYPFHQVFSLLIAMLLGWILCAILTVCGVFSDDPTASNYLARTDARNDIIDRAHWFYVPYPGQFGSLSFSVPIFIAFIVATITSIFDSIGDYYACAKMCDVPPPPVHGVNRGTAIEGFCSAIAGTVGCGHATTTNGGNIGAIGVTRVASRIVFLVVAIIYILFGIIGKFSAVFVTIPYPVLGGALIVMFGMFNGVVLSNLQVVNLNSTRNLAVIGMSLLVGLMIPYYVENNQKEISTGDPEKDNIIKMLLANPNLAGGILACFLDNTIPGTKDERGITAWQRTILKDDIVLAGQYAEGAEVYEIGLPAKITSAKIMKYIPFLHYQPRKEENDVKAVSLTHINA